MILVVRPASSVRAMATTYRRARTQTVVPAPWRHYRRRTNRIGIPTVKPSPAVRACVHSVGIGRRAGGGEGMYSNVNAFVFRCDASRCVACVRVCVCACVWPRPVLRAYRCECGCAVCVMVCLLLTAQYSFFFTFPSDAFGPQLLSFPYPNSEAAVATAAAAAAAVVN